MRTPNKADRPDNLGPAGAELWDRLTSITDEDGNPVAFGPHELEYLRLAARTADDIGALEYYLERNGDITVAGSTGQPITNPVIVELRAQRASLRQILRQIDWPGDTTAWDHLSATQRARKAAIARWS